ncbi:MAG: SagB/ThcOx family dehydrogenase [Syntrophorhabdaceae bacterium]|nr:SagB/ThcOx family dehydrogenase [Syntrophorhabdaceae bacterium]
MKKVCLLAPFLFIALIVSPFFNLCGAVYAQTIKLPEPKVDGPLSIEKAIKERRSIRSYKPESLTIEAVSQVLWAAQGITEPQKGLRTAPSARAQYLIEVYLIADNVTDLKPGLYKYIPKGHLLQTISLGDAKERLFGAAGQTPIKNAPCALLITGHIARSTNPGWIYLEAGHSSQNVYLQCVSLNFGTVAMAGFKPEEVKKALNIPDGEQPIYIMPIGKK